MAPEGWRRLPNIDRDIKNTAADCPDQLSLSKGWALKM
jgi:hypothetical protein